MGAALFFAGLMLIALGYLIYAAEEYNLLSGVSISGFLALELYSGVQSLLTGFGVLIGSLGWVLDRSARDRQSLAATGLGHGPSWMAGLALLFAGVLLVVGSSFAWTYIYFARYWQVQLNLWMYTAPALDVVLGLGIALIAVGWLVQHLESLARTEHAGP